MDTMTGKQSATYRSAIAQLSGAISDLRELRASLPDSSVRAVIFDEVLPSLRNAFSLLEARCSLQRAPGGTDLPPAP